MELPIPPEDVLGVPAGAGDESLDSRLRQRLTPPAWADLDAATLEARAAWLQWAADQLKGMSSPAPTGEAAQLAGLLLLLEAGEAASAFERLSTAAEDALPGQAEGDAGPADGPPDTIGATRTAELRRDRLLLLRHSCLGAAEALHRRRRYQEEDRLLQRGLRLLEGSGQDRALRERRRRLAPFRILELIARGPGDARSRLEGLALLEQLVEHRGGLGPSADDAFAPGDFQAFLGQIRSLLTVQEWSGFCEARLGRNDGSARLPLAEALVASGFRQRKPHRVERALELVRQSPSVEAGRMLPHLHLLLGDVREARAADPGQSLENLCDHCRSWLESTILPGYHEADTHADLEAWYEDREVLEHLERRFRGGGASPAKPADSPESLRRPPRFAALSAAPPAASPPGWLPLPSGRSDSLESPVDPDEPATRSRHRQDFPKRPGGSANARPRRRRGGPAAALGYLGAGAVLGLTLQHATGLGRAGNGGAPSEPSQRTAGAASGAATLPGPGRNTTAAALSLPAASRPGIAPLTTPTPSAGQVRGLLQAWLDSKGTLLRGQSPALPPDRLAEPPLVAALEAQRDDDRRSGLRQRTLARVDSVQLLSRGERTIEAEARIRYADEVLDARGQVMARTPLVRLTNAYDLSFSGGTWRVSGWRPRGPATPLPMLSERLQEEVR